MKDNENKNDDNKSGYTFDNEPFVNFGKSLNEIEKQLTEIADSLEENQNLNAVFIMSPPSRFFFFKEKWHLQGIKVRGSKFIADDVYPENENS